MPKSRIIRYLSEKKICGLPIDGVVKASESSDEVTRLLEKKLGPLGRYTHRDENNLKIDIMDKRMIYNANIYINGGFKVWFGDIYMDEETQEILKEVSKLTAKTLYVLQEMDGRFLTFIPDDEYLDRVARYKITQDKIEEREPHSTIVIFTNGERKNIRISRKK